MQEWIIAMLAISILLILRDMAKTVLKGRKSRKEGGEHPQKEKVERYAASFQKLADTFYGMPYKKEYLSSAQVENVIRETGERSCRNCYRRELCWGDHAEEMYGCHIAFGISRPFHDLTVRGGNGTCARAGR